VNEAEMAVLSGLGQKNGVRPLGVKITPKLIFNFCP